ncbi:50S ribosomal protein L4 [Candidatus Woesearchaeota archaeon]|nr:MAG: 50S ribosomal protein L4 [Candidatus Woesearchaeota archaeon]
MKAKVFSITGQAGKDIEFPTQFNEEFRPDLIKRAVLAIQAAKRQPYGADPEAGKKHVTKISRRRHKFKGSYGAGISRVPRKIMSARGTRFNWVGALAPGTTGGRRAHPPKAEKIWTQKINVKERRKAIRSALAASINANLVEDRGHKVPKTYPLVVETKAEEIAKTKDAIQMLIALGLKDELTRCQVKKVRAGKGTMRGRRYQRKKGPLVIVSKDSNLHKALRNVTGVDIVVADNLNTELLAPGTAAGRISVYTEDAVAKIGGLFK